MVTGSLKLLGPFESWALTVGVADPRVGYIPAEVPSNSLTLPAMS